MSQATSPKFSLRKSSVAVLITLCFASGFFFFWLGVAIVSLEGTFYYCEYGAVLITTAELMRRRSEVAKGVLVIGFVAASAWEMGESTDDTAAALARIFVPSIAMLTFILASFFMPLLDPKMNKKGMYESLLVAVLAALCCCCPYMAWIKNTNREVIMCEKDRCSQFSRFSTIDSLGRPSRAT